MHERADLESAGADARLELRPAVAARAESRDDCVEAPELEDIDCGVAGVLLLHRGKADGGSELPLVTASEKLQLGVVDARLQPFDRGDRHRLSYDRGRVGGNRRLRPAQQLAKCAD